MHYFTSLSFYSEPNWVVFPASYLFRKWWRDGSWAGGGSDSLPTKYGKLFAKNTEFWAENPPFGGEFRENIELFEYPIISYV